MMSPPATIVRPSPRPARRPASRVAARAFTTIELMVVIAIIAVLLGIVVLGYRRVATGSQENQTRTVLERMRNMTNTITANKAAGQKFFQQQIPTVYADPVADADPNNWWDAVPAYGGAVPGFDANVSHDALYRTALILNVVNANPEAKAIFAELPTQRKRRMHFTTATNGTIAASSGPGVLTVEMPLDAWGNPLLFVFDNWQVPTSATTSKLRMLVPPGETGGLTQLTSASAKGYWMPTNTPGTPLTAAPNPPTPFAAPTGSTLLGTALRSPDRQPFWASAGPDGRMATHDDNVYSYEN